MRTHRFNSVLPLGIPGILLAVAVLWIGSATEANAPVQDRKALGMQVRAEIEGALRQADIDEADRCEIEAARAELAEMHRARREGLPVDPQRLRQASEKVQADLARVLPAAEWAKIRDDVDVLRKMHQAELERRKQARRDAFVEELGWPLGMLAYYASQGKEPPLR
ncbi:MAG: hypothetical protein IPM24_08290 [Bryobacterales bacterium]|nr:hypothetical protein [Bryobacterales bacterium]